MAFADLAKLAVKKMVVDVDEAKHAVIVRRLLLKFLVKQGLTATAQAKLSSPDARDRFISVKHDELGTLHFSPQRLVVTATGAELVFDLEDDTSRSKIDAAKSAATAAAGGLLLLFTGGFLGRGMIFRGAIGAAQAGARITEATAVDGVGRGLSTRVDADLTKVAALADLLARHGGRVAFTCTMKGGDLTIAAPELGASDLRAIVDGLKDQAASLIRS